MARQDRLMRYCGCHVFDSVGQSSPEAMTSQAVQDTSSIHLLDDLETSPRPNHRHPSTFKQLCSVIGDSNARLNQACRFSLALSTTRLSQFDRPLTLEVCVPRSDPDTATTFGHYQFEIMPDRETDIPVSPTSSTEAVDGSSIDSPTSMTTAIATMTLNSGPRLLMPGAGMDPAQAPAQVHGTSDGDQKPETVEAGTLGSQTMQANSHKSASPDKKKGRAIAHRSINNPHQEDVAEAPGKLAADEQPWTDEQYPVDSILSYRNTGMQVDLLVRWGGPWLHHEPTWEPEEDV
ncbi:hypothetical protein K4K49_010585 [Colletotrichum sp. SAR 10_70]|nr:hypothetical protein K4K49_010585 [Colletotrichum sp. SAR 10_70]KAI8159341.1 hypothetical protein K4K50_003145 [Colletotrichum sp. SAR 10_71]KAI8248692.1 hypothetical protein K4K53_000650 [Colletotrichum sp. SAR 10_77]